MNLQYEINESLVLDDNPKLRLFPPSPTEAPG